MTTRAELLTLVLDDLDRQDLNASPQLSFWIKRAEQRIERELRSREMIKRDTLLVTKPVFAVPLDFLQAEKLTLYSATSGALVGGLEYRPTQEFDALRAINNNLGTPAFYTFTGNELELLPSPTGDPTTPLWKLQMNYYAKLKPLVLDSDTNWLSLDRVDLYFDAVTMYGYTFLKEYDQASRLDTSISNTIAIMNAASELAVRGASRLIARSKNPLGVRRTIING